uniref:Uncharacterized protein n=1 Tax=Trachysalambria curvirostris nimavirus TaxID=2984282 RepID=A0A9C7F782_9VIRU|nr:MAG: hypothetical protein [Trachysalambria curvirostris nimavirus]
MDTIMQWNCQGVHAKWEELQHLLASCNPVCVCLQEIISRENQSISLRGYQTWAHFGSNNGRPHGGAAVMVRHDIPVHAVDLQTTLQVKAVRIGLTRPYTVASIYLPPGDLNIEELEDVIGQLPQPFLLLGDFNGRNILWGDTMCNSRGRALESLFLRNDAVVLNGDNPTHFQIQTGTFSNIDLSVSSGDIQLDFTWQVMEDLHGSDHFPILLERVNGIPTNGIRRWQLERADWSLFRSIAEMQGSVEDFHDVQEAADYLTSHIHAAAEAAIPKSTGKYRRPPVPWWSDECQQAVRARKAALRQWKRRPSDATLIFYKKTRACARRVLKEARRKSWRQYVSMINSHTPLTWVWDKVRKIAGKITSVSPPALKIDGTIITNKADVANELAKSMAEISSGASYTARFSTYRAEQERQPLSFFSRTAAELPYNLPFSRREMDSALQLCRKTAPGSDDIPYQMVSHLPESSLEFLLALFNKIFREGTVPITWKEAIIIPIPKPGKDAAIPGNYRPISLTSCICKLMEKMVNFRLTWYLEKENILTPYQYGFRKLRSTTDALVRLETAIRNSFAQRRHTLAVFFDLEKAYDTTWKHGILMKLHDIGLRGALPTFVQNFLTERKFRVRVGDSLSDQYVQQEGVPQGSILSVTLFAIAINDIVKAVPRAVSCSLYVDDFTLYCSGGSLKDVQNHMQTAVNQVSQWATYHGFKFSPNKSVAMHFRKRRGNFHPSLFLGANPLQFVEEVKFLGLTFDPRLTWVPHIKNLKIKATKALGILRVLSHLSWGSDRTTLLRLYRALVRSKIDYGCEAYSSATPTVLKMLDSVHNEALRLCTGAFRSSPVQSLYAESGEPPLNLHRDYMNLIYYTRLQRIPNSPTYRAVFNPHVDNQSYGGRMRNLVDDLSLNLSRVLPVGIPQVPPWTNPVELDLVGIGKRERSEGETKARFLEHASKYQGSKAIFTDGSKTKDGVGFAAVSSWHTAMGSLPAASSIFTAELYAILSAVKMTRDQMNHSFVIYCDSRSALQAIFNLNSSHPVVREVQDWLAIISRRRKITLCWVPAHVGVQGNELADQRAKAAAAQPCDATFPLPHTDMKPSIRLCLRERWREQWRLTSNNKLREIKDDLGCWETSLHPNRQIEVVLTRLRIGHTRLTHGWLMAGGQPPHCEGCQEPLTVAHVVERCAEFSDQRRRYLSPPFTLRSVLGEDCDIDSVISFLKETNILNMI